VPEVIITHPKTGESYGIQSYDFRRGKHYQQPDGEMVSFEEAGFEIVSLGDGSTYTPPTPRHPAPAEDTEAPSS
jgi:hypothetical protein